MDFALKSIGCLGGTFAFAYLLRAPREARLPGAIIGLVGFWAYLAAMRLLQAMPVATFAGALCVAILGEVAARRMKMPVTIFTTVGIVPLVPGVGLYETMLLIAQNDLQGGLHAGALTIMMAIAIAIAIAVVSIAARIARG